MSDPTDGPDPTEPASDATPAPSADSAAAPPAEDAATATTDAAAPVMTPPPDTMATADATEDAAESTPWPTSAKVWVGILAVIALLAGIATIVGFSEASSNDDDTATVEQERDAAINRAQGAEQERDEVAEALEESESANAALTSELVATESELEDAQAANEVLAATVETERTRAEEAEAELAAVGEAFPVTVPTSMVGLEVAGNYTISFTEEYCDFATGCGTTPQADQAIIGVTPENFLDITIPGILEGGLFAVNGGLYAITDSDTAIAPCGDVPRLGRITITIWPASIIVAEDGTRTVTNLEASITLDAPTLNECPSGLVFWGVTLTPTG